MGNQGFAHVMMKYTMAIAKKLSFAPLFLASFYLLCYQLKPLFTSYDFIFSLSLETLLTLAVVSGLICLTALLFVVFVSLANDWKMVLGTGILAVSLPLWMFDQNIGLVMTIGVTIVLLISFLSLENTLKNYLTFAPSAIFGPSIRQMIGLLILTASITYFLSINKVVADKGFSVPDALIDQAIKMTGQASPSSQGTALPQQISIPPQQLELLKKNPQLLKQYGLDPSILNSLPQTGSTPVPISGSDVIRSTLKTQLNNMIKPYLGAVPALLAVLFFFILQSLTAILNILVYPLLWLVFKMLEKTGFIRFTEEQRTVKKMVI